MADAKVVSPESICYRSVCFCHKERKSAMRLPKLCRLLPGLYVLILTVVLVRNIDLIRSLQWLIFASVPENASSHHVTSIDEESDLQLFTQERNILIFPHAVNSSCGLWNDGIHHRGQKENTTVVVVLKSRPGEVFHRNAIRQTWGRSLKGKLIFVLGHTSATMEGTIDPAIQLEANRHQDILLFDFYDSYQNLSIKSLSILRWICKHCQKPQFYVQGDSDILLFYEQLLVFMTQRQTTSNMPAKIYGKCWQAAKVRREGKWYSPLIRINNMKPFRRVSAGRYVFRRYPVYCSGAAYIVTNSVPQRLLGAFEASTEYYFAIDDVYFTGIIAERALVTRQHIGVIIDRDDIDVQLQLDSNDSCSTFRPMVLFEYRSSEQLRSNWHTLQTHFRRCSQRRYW